MFETNPPRYNLSVVLMGIYFGAYIFGRYNTENGTIETIKVTSTVAEAVSMFWTVKNDKVRGIKLLREVYGVGLKEAKDMMEQITGTLH